MVKTVSNYAMVPSGLVGCRLSHRVSTAEGWGWADKAKPMIVNATLRPLLQLAMIGLQ